MEFKQKPRSAPEHVLLTYRVAIPPATAMATLQTDLTDLLRLIRAEYRELPGLRLTQRQAQRLWNLDSTTCEAALDQLEAARFLRRTSDDSYVLDMRGH
jgi:hypothetical protein